MKKISIKYTIHKSFRVLGINKDSLNIKSLFDFKHQKKAFTVKIHFSYTYEEPLKFKIGEKAEILSTEVEKINIELSNKSQKGYEYLKEIIGEPLVIRESNSDENINSQKTQLYTLLVNIVNVVLKNIRIVGECTLVNEIPIEPYKANAFLNNWNVEKRENNENSWVKVIDIEGLSQLLYFRQIVLEERPFSYFIADNWPDVEDALNDKLSTDIQYELLINSQDYLELGNYRMAIAECVSALDIVLKEYIGNYYKLDKKAPSKIIEDILNPNFTLSEQIGTIVYLVLKEKYRLDDNLIESILKMNKLRNAILHKGKSLSKEEKKFVRENGFKNIRYLTEILSDEIKNMKLSSELKDKLTSISKKYKIPMPVIIKKKRHNYNVIVHFLNIGVIYEIPDKNKFKEISSKLIEILEQHDSYFEKEKNLKLRFIEGFPKPETLAFWKKSILEINE